MPSVGTTVRQTPNLSSKRYPSRCFLADILNNRLVPCFGAIAFFGLFTPAFTNDNEWAPKFGS